MQSRDRIPATLLGVYVVLWLALAIAPHDRMVWFFENILIVVGLPLLVWSHRRFAFSSASYVAMFTFLCLHALGAHFGYTKVPIPWQDWGFERNNSDRVVHFIFGLLAVMPTEEVLRRIGRLRTGWCEALAVVVTFAIAAGFEVVEWLAVLVGGDWAGPVEGGYLGTQGDEFDAVKDMGLGLLGAATTMAVVLLRRRKVPRGPAE